MDPTDPDPDPQHCFTLLNKPHLSCSAFLPVLLGNRLNKFIIHLTSVADSDPNPDPSDPNVFGPPGFRSGSISQRYGSESGSGSFYHQAKIVRKTLIPTVLWLLFDFLVFIFKMMKM